MSGKDADNMHKITELPAWERLFKRYSMETDRRNRRKKNT